ncbi:putative Calcineurin like phosphoesterase [Trypanosoma vivax]|uniref:Serine/threonine-protein phosphatase n=1 Tax=Trypanosoma vivax (strain Y486) TaxID=1055687 RepID=G0UB41_TRYVY|nr:putative protein phosphatase [Trypanosoma vivax]KAH8606240.1 putative Calcineurin like phosphoesterase [Trypanosoma vivax]CCC53028.1 putative protein phosphotase [Trypanosoma vivax Y486]
MWLTRHVAVSRGVSLVVGTTESCDVVVRPVSVNILNGRCHVSCQGEIARVACTARGQLLLTQTRKHVRIFVNGIQMNALGVPMELQHEDLVSFVDLHWETSFCFFARKAPQNLGMLRRSLASFSLTFSQSSEPQVAHLAQPRRASPFLWRRLHKWTPLEDPPKPSGALETELEEDLFPATDNTDSLTVLSEECSAKSSIGDTNSGSEDGELAAPPPPPPPPPALQKHFVSPAVVELRDNRVSLYSILDNQQIMENSESDLLLLSDKLMVHDRVSQPDPYITRRGFGIMKGLHCLHHEPPVRMAAALVMENLSDAYEENENDFISLTPAAKEEIFKNFLLLAEHSISLSQVTSLTLRLASPVVCCGDIHGSYTDLKIIFDNVVPFRHWSLMTTPVLFLGDYVDRGPHDVEVMLFLLAWQALCPTKVFLLRGNHEDDEVNGSIDLYGDTSFLSKCIKYFGEARGKEFWDRVNDVFASMPVIAVIDGTIFACHGGIPCLSAVENSASSQGTGEANEAVDGQDVTVEGSLDEWQQGKKSNVTAKGSDVPCSVTGKEDGPSVSCESLMGELLQSTPGGRGDVRFRHLMPVKGDDKVTAQRRRIIRELLWNDPIPSSEQDNHSSHASKGSTEDDAVGGDDPLSKGPERRIQVDENGFRCNLMRGSRRDTIREFNAFALNAFMERWGFTLIIRAHQQKDAGLEMALCGRMLTLFSSSNYSGDANRAGACIISNGEVRLVTWRGSDTQPSAPSTFSSIDTQDRGKGSRSFPLLDPDVPLVSDFDSLGRPLTPQVAPSYLNMEQREFG